MTRILVIDDEASVRKILCDNLRMSGFEVTGAADGHEGVNILKAGRLPDIVITDLIMPNKSGLDVIAEILRDYPGIKIIAISGGGRIDASHDLLEKARETGAHAVFSKPVDLDLLERTIEGMLG